MEARREFALHRRSPDEVWHAANPRLGRTHPILRTRTDGGTTDRLGRSCSRRSEGGPGVQVSTRPGSDLRAAFDRDGYVIVPRALEREHVERLIEAVDRAYLRHAAPDDPLHLLAFAGEDPAFIELLDHPTTFPLVVDLLGANIFMYHGHLDVHPPVRHTSPQVWGWHQDGGVQNTDLETDPRPRMSVKIAYFLSDCSEPGRGNTRIIPGSHLRNTLPRPAPRQPLAEPQEAIEVLAAPGDAMVFDRRLWHSKSPNRSSFTRRMLFYAYTYRWIRPRDELRVAPEALGAITPSRAQLLGAGRSAAGQWLLGDEHLPLRASLGEHGS